MADESMTTDELEARARDLEISGRSSMNKGELIDAINAAEGTEGADESGTADTDEALGATDDGRDRTPRLPDAMAKARQAERERLAAQDEAVEQRPGASLPEELATIREQTRAAEAEGRSVRDTPETA